jgi:hypothetical protein
MTSPETRQQELFFLEENSGNAHILGMFHLLLKTSSFCWQLMLQWCHLRFPKTVQTLTHIGLYIPQSVMWRLSRKVCIPSKRAWFSIQSFELCKARSSHVGNLIICTGKQVPENEAHGSKEALQLKSPLPIQWDHVITIVFKPRAVT